MEDLIKIIDKWTCNWPTKEDFQKIKDKWTRQVHHGAVPHTQYPFDL